MKLSRVLRGVFSRELQLAYRQRSDLLNPLFFFLIVVTLFPIGITPDLSRLAELAVGVLWIAALLANLLSLDSLFRNDYEAGSLEQLLLAAVDPYWLVLCKVIVHWLVTGLPLALLSPLLAMMLGLNSHAMPLLILTLALGTLTLSLFGSVAAALTLGLRQGGLLLTVLIMPLFIPVIIFGTQVVQSALLGVNWMGQLAMLVAICLAALMFTPLLTVAALKISLDT